MVSTIDIGGHISLAIALLSSSFSCSLTFVKGSNETAICSTSCAGFMRSSTYP